MLIRRRKIARKHVQTKLIFKLRLFFIIMIIMIGIITYDILNSVISAPFAFAGILAGTAVGFARGRLTNIIWNDESSKVISRMDRLGILVLIIYLPFTIFKKWIFGYWIHGPVLTAFTFSFVAGALCGRIFSMRRKIRKLLKIQGILKSN